MMILGPEDKHLIDCIARYIMKNHTKAFTNTKLLVATVEHFLNGHFTDEPVVSICRLTKTYVHKVQTRDKNEAFFICYKCRKLHSEQQIQKIGAKPNEDSSKSPGDFSPAIGDDQC